MHFWIVPVLAASVFQGNEGRSDPRPAIWDQFKARQALAVTVEAEWTERRIRTGVGAIAAGENLDTRGAMPAPFEFPSNTSRLILSKDLVRFENLIPTRVATDDLGGSRALEQAEIAASVAAFDGARQQSLTASTTQSGPNGRISARDRFNEWRNIHLLPLFLATRPLETEIAGPDPNAWEVEHRPAVIDGVECIVLRSSHDSHFVRRLFLDPSRDYVPLRYTNEDAGRPHAQADMKYDRTEEHLWLPTSWAAVYYYSPRDTRSFERSDNDAQKIVLGGSVADNVFSIEYPPGTDLTIDNVPGLAPRMVVDHSGAWIPLRKAIAEGSTNGMRWWWILGFAGACAILFGIIRWWRLQEA